MNPFKIKIHERAIEDIRNGFNYYEEKQAGLGLRFNKSVQVAIETLKLNPYYQLRYNTIRCFPVKRFPFLIHFEISEEKRVVNIYAVINTHLDPQYNWLQ